MPQQMLKVEGLNVTLGGRPIVEDAGFTVDEGQWLMVVGPNGAGKTTLVNAIVQSVPYTGHALFCGEDIASMPPRQLAKNIGMLMQNHNISYSFTVEEVVRMGRYAHARGLLGGPGEQDEEKIGEALDITGLSSLRNQSVLTLSGGELQRTFLAQALAQDPRLLILDEPANHLDLVYQKQVFAVLAKWALQPGRSVISVVHDLSLAKAYGSHALLMDQSRIAAFGPIDTVMQNDTLSDVYGMDVYAWMQDMLGQWEQPPPGYKVATGGKDASSA